MALRSPEHWRLTARLWELQVLSCGIGQAVLLYVFKSISLEPPGALGHALCLKSPARIPERRPRPGSISVAQPQGQVVLLKKKEAKANTCWRMQLHVVPPNANHFNQGLSVDPGSWENRTSKQEGEQNPVILNREGNVYTPKPEPLFSRTPRETKE